MELGTFGAVMGFAVKVVSQAEEFYGAALPNIRDGDLAATIRSLGQAANKDRATIEQTRRENVTEMILEPISGLAAQDYSLDPDQLGQSSDSEIRASARLLEERNKRFLNDAAQHVPLPEAARVFRTIARRKEKDLAKLDAATIG